MSEMIEGFPVSLQQRHLWMVGAVDAGPAGHTRGAIQIEGDLDPDCLCQAVDMVIARHEILRTTFSPIPNGEMLQRVEAARPVAIPELSLDEGTKEEAAVAAALRDLAEPPFDLERGPTLRLALMRTAPGRAVLLAALPALCADVPTLEGLARDIAAAYGSMASGASWLDEPLQYADVAQWQNEMLEAEDTAAGREHWSDRRLWDAFHVPLPFEKIPGTSRFALESIPVPLATKISDLLQDLAAHQGVPISTLLLACWGLLLWRLNGGEPVPLTTLTDGRRLADLDQALGPLARYVPIPFLPVAGESLLSLLNRTAAAERDACRNQEYFSWEGAAAIARKKSALPIAFEFQGEPGRYYAGATLFSLVEGRAGIDLCKLALVAHQRDGRLSAELSYDSSLFASADISCLADQLATLTEAVTETPDTVVEGLRIASVAEQRRILETFNDTRWEFPQHLSLHQLIEEQARQRPEALAVVQDDRRLTYAELNARAGAVARVLRSLGVGPEAPVAIFTQRTPEMVIAILGTLKAGGAYVPLDPGNPRDRLELILADCAAAVLLTEERLVPDLPAGRAAVVCLDRLDERVTETVPLADLQVDPDNLAYVIYTSGSTGRPKGVLVSHRNAVHSTMARFRTYQEPVGAFVLLSSHAFDSSVAGLFWTLCQGGSLVLPREELQWDLPSLTELVVREHATHILCLPSLYSLILEQAAPGRLGSLRAVLVAGEACPPEVIERHARYLPSAEMFNEYGPTEATVWCTVSEIGRLAPGEPVPIGRPIPNVQIRILRPDGESCAIGEPGELSVAGAGITRGYLNRPDLTAERFLPNAFANEPGARLYRTGDLARFRPDGVIDYLGRIDHQVKIRGFRVELGEIESVLALHATVLQTAVTAREESPGNLRLVAYLVLREGMPAPPVAELRLLLHQKLPEHMVPTAFVVLPGLPLNANGKLDRKALPAPGEASRHRAEYVAPRSEVERTIAAIWCDVLQVEKIGVHDNFFDLGGQSLLMVRVNRKVREALGCEVSVLEMFRFPTVSTLAEFLSAGGSKPRTEAQEERQGEARKAHRERRRDNLEKRRATRRPSG